VWLEFTQSKNLDEDKILNKIEAVQQSKKEFTPSVVLNSAGALRCSLNDGSGVEIEIDRQLSVSSHFSYLLVVNRRHDYSPD
jgi:hypothetical protein